MPLSSGSSTSETDSEGSDSHFGSSRNVGAKAAEDHAFTDSAMAYDDDTSLREKLRQAESKIKELTDEVQRLLVEKVALQTEVSQLKFELAGRSSDSSPFHTETERGYGDFEAVRKATKARAELSEKEKEVARWKSQCAELQQELQKLKYRISVHNDQAQVATTDPKKKKTWWGGTKKTKKGELQSSPTLIITDEMDMIGPSSMMPASAPSKSSKSGGMSAAEMLLQAQHWQKIQKAHADKVEALNQRIISLEREKAKADAETELLEKERRSLTEKISRLEGVIESLKTQQQLMTDHDRFSVGKGLLLHLSMESGVSEVDRWKSMVQIQESALRKVSTQKQELERQLAYLTSMHGESNNRYAMSPEVTRLREDLIAQNKLLVESRQKVEDLALKLKSSQLKEKYLMDEIQKAKSTMNDYEKLFQNRVESHKRHQDAIVSMLGAALAENEVLQETTADQREQRTKDIMSLHGEIRALRQGRAGRMKGEAPGKPVFPSPLGAGVVDHADDDYTSTSERSRSVSRHHHHHCRKGSHPKAATIASSASSETSTDSASDKVQYDSSLAKQYHYEWSNGAYVLKQSPPPTPVLPILQDMPIEVQTQVQPGDERDKEIAKEALRNWNLSPPRPPRERNESLT